MLIRSGFMAIFGHWRLLPRIHYRPFWPVLIGHLPWVQEVDSRGGDCLGMLQMFWLIIGSNFCPGAGARHAAVFLVKAFWMVLHRCRFGNYGLVFCYLRRSSIALYQAGRGAKPV